MLIITIYYKRPVIIFNWLVLVSSLKHKCLKIYGNINFFGEETNRLTKVISQIDLYFTASVCIRVLTTVKYLHNTIKYNIRIIYIFFLKKTPIVGRLMREYNLSFKVDVNILKSV